MPALLAATSPSIGPVLLAITLGVLVTLTGHLTSSRRTAAVGILIIFAATLAMFASGLGVYQRDR
jgi:4-amino-4-deoxy-L-arabinose transferase-like glycosyltransferase